MLFYFLSLITIPFIYSQNTCDNCINSIKIGQIINCDDICDNQVTHLDDCLDYTRCLYDYDLHKENDECRCQKTECGYDHVCPNIEELHFTNNIDGYTIYEISLELKNPNSNLYAIYGEPLNLMILPPAYQLENHRGADIGGINPLLIQYVPETQYDSWLTIQLTDGNVIGQVDAIGIDFSSWGPNSGLVIDNGAIFLDDPLLQLSDSNKYVIGHLNLKDSEDHQMIINVNGKIDVNNPLSHYRENNIIFNFIKKEIGH